MATISDNLQAVRRRIGASGVTLLAVSKGHGAERVQEAASLGLRAFGENYVQEALAKMNALETLRVPPLEWHLIGPLQANKTRFAAERFAWIQTIDRERVAVRLSEQRPAALPPLNVLIQVNISGERSKHGVAAGEARALAKAVAAMPRLHLRGLMAIPAPGAVKEFAQMKALYDGLRREFGFDTLSMGMSEDLEAAIAAGATMVRIGTALFGERQKEKTSA